MSDPDTAFGGEFRVKGKVYMDLYQKLLEVSRCFRIEDQYVGYETIQMGNVNQTYKVNFLLADGKPKSFLVQNVNTYAFRDPVGLMENIDKVTEHIRVKNPGQLCLHFHHTWDRKTYVEDGKNFWRMTNFIPSVTYNAVQDPTIIYNAGIAFGEFQEQLSDFDIRELKETIPGFHDTRRRYESFRQAVQEDKMGRAKQCRKEIDYLLLVEDIACTLTDLYNRGELPLRVTHNDTKINNVLFNPEDNRALVVIDLDTVMPGLMGNDFGDAIRFAANFAEEDCPDPEKAGVNLSVFRAFAEGFLKKTADAITPKERETLALSSICLTAEVAVRFLDDYLRGDLYFKIKDPQHNLTRTRCQIALCQDMLKKRQEMEKIIDECFQKAK